MASFIQGKRGTATDSQAQANALVAQLAELKRLKQADETERRMVTDLESTMKHRDLGQENTVRGMRQKDRELEQADVELLREAEALKLQQAAEARFQAEQDNDRKQEAIKRALSLGVSELATGPVGRGEPVGAPVAPAMSPRRAAALKRAEAPNRTTLPNAGELAAERVRDSASSAPASQAKAGAADARPTESVQRKIEDMKPSEVFSDSNMAYYQQAAKRAAARPEAKELGISEGEYLEYFLSLASDQATKAAFAKQSDTSRMKAENESESKETSAILKARTEAGKFTQTYERAKSGEWEKMLGANSKGIIGLDGGTITVPPKMLARFQASGYREPSEVLDYIYDRTFEKILADTNLTRSVYENRDESSAYLDSRKPANVDRPPPKEKKTGAKIGSDLDGYESKKKEAEEKAAAKEALRGFGFKWTTSKSK